MATLTDVQAAADKNAAAAASVIADLGSFKTAIASISAKLTAALAAGSDPVALTNIAAELGATSDSLAAAHADAVASLPST
jgi:hypothetical protein